MIVHKTKDGVELFICSMDDDHLMNTIRYIITHLETAKSIVEKVTRSFDHLMYGSEMSEEQAEDLIRNYDRYLSAYVLEANVRKLNIDNEMERLNNFLERSTAKKVSINKKMISYSGSGWDLDEDDFI